MFSHPTQRTWNDGLQSLLSGITDAIWFWKMIPMIWRNTLLPCSGHLCYSFPNVYINPLKTIGMFTTKFNTTSSAFSNTMYLHVWYDSYNWHFIPIHYLISLRDIHCVLCVIWTKLVFIFKGSSNMANKEQLPDSANWSTSGVSWVVLWYMMWPC
jgi:hypothetical protein